MKYLKNFYQIKSSETIFEALKKESSEIGYYNLPFCDIEHIIEYSEKVKHKHIIVVGIGGSSLGTFAIYEFLKNVNSYEKELHFLESTDPVQIRSVIKKISLDDALFVIISKSGATIETISIFKYLSSIVKMNVDNCVIVSESDTKLTQYAQQNGMQTFTIPKNVGGRFSVFSAVGLLPLAIVGVDIKSLLAGAQQVSHSFFNKNGYYKVLMEKARFIVENKSRFSINVLFSYSASLEGFNKWYVQLWGESLGKLNVNSTRQAFTPIGLIGPVDQHSFLQLIMDGNRDKTVTFIKIENVHDELFVPQGTLENFDELAYIDNIKFSDLINTQADATIEAISDLKDIPFDVIGIKQQDEESIAKLMFSTQLLTSIVGRYVQINTYTQPGVEAGKIILKNKLQGKR